LPLCGLTSPQIRYNQNNGSHIDPAPRCGPLQLKPAVVRNRIVMETIKLKYSEPFIREAIRSYWWKQVGPIFPIVSLLLTVFLIYQIANGDRSWVVGAIGTVLFLAFVTMAAVYIVNLRRSLKRLRRMKVPEATLELGEERFRVTSDIGSSEIEWSLISQVWRFEKVWLLFFSAGEFMTIPIAEFTPESKEFIVSKAEANGAKIT